jgi:phage terminase large subunit-like protein
MAKYAHAREAWDMLQFGLRLGNNPRQMITTTPRPIPVLKEIMAAPSTVVTRGSTYENLENLAKSYSAIVARYEGTRLGRQELNAEILDDLPGALWTREMLDKARTRGVVPDLQRIVVSIDPSGTAGTEDDGDSIGIIVAGRDVNGQAHVLADRTCKLSPASWGRRAVEAYQEFKADRIIAERNFGGAMVRHVIETTNPKVAYEEVTASRGKVIRAEPVAALYEQGRVSHHGLFPELEDQMCQFSSTGYIGEGSPDRVDALVWAITDLMLGETTIESAELLL